MSKYTGWQEDLATELAESIADNALIGDAFKNVMDARELGDFSKEAVELVELIISDGANIEELLELINRESAA